MKEVYDMTKTELTNALAELNVKGEALKTAERDITIGYRDRLVGYYDKWYRYNRKDEGKAYDKGVQIALTKKACKSDMRIIPA